MYCVVKAEVWVEPILSEGSCTWTDDSHVSTLNSTSITISTLELVKEFGKPNFLPESSIEKDLDLGFY